MSAGTLRVPPHSIEAEQAVLGGLMLASLGGTKFAADAFGQVDAHIGSEHFYRVDHRLIFDAIRELADKGQAFDSVTVGDWFEKQGLAAEVEDGAYLISLASTTPSAANIEEYAKIVLEKHRLRMLIEIGTKLVNAGFNPEGREALDLISRAQTALSNLMVDEPCELEEIRPILDRMFDGLRERAEAGGALDGLSTGLDDFDDAINGLKGGKVYVIAGRPGMGKSALALAVAQHVAVKQGQGVDIFSFEMPQEECTERLTCSESRVLYDRFAKGDLEDEDWAKVSEAVRRLKKAPIRISKPRNARVESVIAQIRRGYAKRRIKVVVIDYLQLIDTPGAENRNAGITEVSRKLKLLAVELDIAIVLLSQLNRSVEQRADKRPVMADLRESGAIEQDADVIVFLYRDEYYNPASADKGTVELIIAKQRRGRTGMRRVADRLDICRFDNLAFGWEPSVDASKPAKTGFRRIGNPGADRAAGAQ